MRGLADLPLRLRLLLGGAAAGAVIIVIIVILLVSSSTDAAYEQPIAYSHAQHAGEYGIQCQYCHVGVTQGPVAGIPSVEKCMGCHTYIATEEEEIQKLADYYANEEPIPWVRVNHQPTFVYFNHSSHVAQGVTCGACHGDVAGMDVVEPVVNMNMGFCLDCHAEQDNKDALWDCVVCHR